MATDFGEILRILAIFIQRRRKRVSLQKQQEEMLHKMHGVAGINKHRLDWPQSASGAVLEPHYDYANYKFFELPEKPPHATLISLYLSLSLSLSLFLCLIT